ncbi:MAG: hypothetical protein J6U00_14260 [Ruminococcus sp.]|uniref:hypothetical protein n=1 Tax=Ruminococcus sp. TaxID=41978 RepID=UPI001B00DED4|nr:hypothetical protein [Ruminococcus sp.]MBO7475135.1 hypothetical protein [Ruminococcus sp.]
MFKGKYKFADRIVEVDSIYEEVHNYCRDYYSDEVPDFSISTSQEDIDFEYQRELRCAAAEGREPIAATDEYREELAVYRKIAERMPDYDTVLFHGSAIAVDGQCFLFTAKSGTGKSTHTRLWREYFGDKAVMVNDDKPLVRITNGGAVAYGTPYNGKHRLGCNISVPLKAVCILARGSENKITRVTKSEAYSMLIQQVYRPQSPVQLAKTLRLIDELAAGTDLYRLECNMDIKAAEVAYNGMKG